MSRQLITQLEERFPGKDCCTDAESLQKYGRDWTRFHQADALAIVFPRLESDVAWLVSFARQHQLALVPSGGRTGLSAGAVAIQGEIVVSLERMDKIIDYNAEEATVRCQAGVITANLQQFAEQQGMYYPVDFASTGSSHIGGNVATNAGGIRVIRYGMTRDHVVGLKVITGTGEILSLNNGLIKNATGYDLRHLLIGSEGTLGIITEVTVKLTKPPGPQSVIVLGVDDLSALMPVLSAFRKELTISAFEFFSDEALEKVIKHQNLQPPLESRTRFYALVEVDTGNQDSQTKIMHCFEYAIQQGWVIDGVMSSSDTQARSLWKLREGISEAITPWMPYKNDISVTSSKVAEFLDSIESKIMKAYPGYESIWFGHIGDGNLHLNILKPDNMDVEKFNKTCNALSDIIYSEVSKFKGSIAAEHGVGLLKKQFLHYSRNETEVRIMRGIKNLFDPDNIMNPGKII